MSDPSKFQPKRDQRTGVNLSGSQTGDVQFGDVAGGDVNKPTIIINPPKLTLEERLAQRNRAALIQLVEQTWLDGVLRASLHHQVRLELGLTTRPDTVDHPWRTVVRLPNQEAQSFPPGTPIADVFAQAAGRLLILGSPGSGKTTTLLMLAEQLLDLAHVDETVPIPVVFVLSTWSQGQPPLNQWLVDELRQRYKVDPKLGKVWVEQKLILPLLDGLDEVGSSDADRAACIAAINGYLTLTGASAVVCSRSAEYERQGGRLELDAAVEIQPLTPVQSDSYLAQLGPPLAGLRLAIERDVALGELAASPLLLDVMVLTYRDVTAEVMIGQERAEAERRLWQQYVDNRFAQVRGDVKTEASQMHAWLVWLARGMVVHQQQVFYVEYLQPSWLARRWQSNSFGGLVGGLLGCILGVLVGSLGISDEPSFVLLYLESAKILVGVSAGLIAGLIFGSLTGITFGLFKMRREIVLSETLSWNWTQVFDWQRSRYSLFFGMSTGLFFGLTTSIANEPVLALIFGVNIAFGIIIVFGLGTGLIAALQSNELQVTSRTNEGILRSLVNAINGGIRTGASVVLIIILYSLTSIGFVLLLSVVLTTISGPELIIADREINDFSALTLYCIVTGFVFGLFRYGGIVAMKHSVLRLLLLLCGAPWNFDLALNEAVSRNLMTRVGGGYRFYHRLLQEHFAEHEQPELPVAPILGPQQGDSVGGRRARQQ